MVEGSNDSIIEVHPMPSLLNTLMQISCPYIFIVSIIGICGNFLTIIMLSKKSLSKNFNNCTLIALALTDLLFNFTLVARCINDLTQSNNEQLCHVLAFLSHLAELLSACFTAHFTAQRFLAVRFPLSVFMEKKIHLIHYFIVSLCILLGICYCLALVRYNFYENCHEELDLKWFLSDALLSFLIPFTIITILNILIILHLKKGFQNNPKYLFTKHSQHILQINFRKNTLSSCDVPLTRRSQSKSDEHSILSNSRHSSLPLNQTNSEVVLLNGRVRSIDFLHRPSSIRSKSQSYRVTRMLIIVSTCFLLFNAPAHIVAVGLKIYILNRPITIDYSNETFQQSLINFKQDNQNSSSTNNTNFISLSRKTSHQNYVSIDHKDLNWIQLLYIIFVITQHIAYASYSINFFLYSFCGMKFRRELIRCIANRRRQITTSRSTTVQHPL